MHAVFAVMADGTRVRVTDPMTWNSAQAVWNRMDTVRLSHRFPQVRFFCVRTMDDPEWLGVQVRVLQTCLTGPGFKNVEDASRKAWRLFAPTFRSRWDKKGTDKNARTGVQGTGGWFYFPNGTTAAQGLTGLARVCRQRNLVQAGLDGRWHVTDTEFNADTTALATGRR